MYKFENLPPAAKKKAKELHQSANYPELRQLLIKHNVVPKSDCIGCGSVGTIDKWMKWGYHNKLL